MRTENKEILQAFLKEASKRKILISDGLYVVRYDDLEKIASNLENQSEYFE